MIRIAKERLANAAIELNEVLGLEPKINPEEEDKVYLATCLREAATLIDWNHDVISEETKTVLSRLGADVPKVTPLKSERARLNRAKTLFEIQKKQKAKNVLRDLEELRNKKRRKPYERRKKVWLWNRLARIEAVAIAAEKADFKFDSIIELAKAGNKIYVESGGKSNVKRTIPEAMRFVKVCRGLSFLRDKLQINSFIKRLEEEENAGGNKLE
jgi:hypothetical protein